MFVFEKNLWKSEISPVKLDSVLKALGLSCFFFLFFVLPAIQTTPHSLPVMSEGLKAFVTTFKSFNYYDSSEYLKAFIVQPPLPFFFFYTPGIKML